jgi:hypothetical protein
MDGMDFHELGSQCHSETVCNSVRFTRRKSMENSDTALRSSATLHNPASVIATFLADFALVQYALHCMTQRIMHQRSVCHIHGDRMLLVSCYWARGWVIVTSDPTVGTYGSAFPRSLQLAQLKPVTTFNTLCCQQGP